MLDPSLIGAGVGLISSIFGGQPKTPGYVKGYYDMLSAMNRRAMDLYDHTDLATQDKATVDAYGQGAMNRAMQMATNYDAKAGAMGSPLWKADTAKDRARTQIFGDSASRIADLEANLSSTRADRQAALLPHSAGGGQEAMFLDEQQNAQNAAGMDGLMAAAKLAALLAQKGPRQQQPSGGVNSRLGGLTSGSVSYQSPYQPSWLSGSYNSGYHG